MRVIKLMSKRPLHRIPKLNEINFNDIDYFIYWDDSIEIVSKGSSGEIHYNGNETDLKKKPKGVSVIHIFLEGNPIFKLILVISLKLLIFFLLGVFH